MNSKNPTRFIPLALLAVWGFSSNLAVASPPPGGVAPVDPPPYGFAIDGDLMANTPATDVGDWISNTNLAPGIGGSVLTLAGVPINSSRTFHLRDPYNGNDNVFKGGMKWRDNPNLWQWTTNKASSKTDINNALLHLTSDTNGHTWAVVAADRYSTSGDSYIDFEFLQSSLTANANFTFTSAGTNGGRTVGDLVLSLAFVGGGSYADFFAFRWQTNGSGGFTYVDVTAALPAGRVFLAFNSNTVAVPYNAFNQTTYDPNAFAEAAIDLTAMLGNFDQCASFGFKTIMIKTKSSASDTATIEDFITPFQYTLRIGPDAQAGPDQVRCTEGAETTFPLTGSAGSGLSTVASTTWSVLSGNATVDDTNSLVTTARVSSASATLRLTVVQANGCTETDDIVLSVQQPPACSITGVTNTCPRTTNTFNAPAGMTSYAWSVSGSAFISGPTNQQTVKVAAGASCGTNYTIALNLSSNACSVFCATDVAVIDTGAPVLTCPPDLTLNCPAVTTTNATGVATATDTCSRVTVTYSDEATAGCGVSRVIARTWTASDECGNVVSCVQTITVRDITPPVITCPTNRTLQCPADTSTGANGVATAVDACGAATVTFDDVITTNCGNTFVISRRWTATDVCSNSSSCTQTITVRDTTPPVIACPANATLEYPADTTTNNTGVATASDNCGSTKITFTDSTTNRCGNTFIIARKWTATDDCGNNSSCTQTITVRDTSPPVISCPPDVTLECPADTRTNATGAATVTDAGGSATITFSDVTNNFCGNTKVITRTWTATDQCTNRSTCVQTIRVVDTSPPVITCASNKTVECTTAWTFNPPTSTDMCGTNTIAIVGTVTNAGCGNTFAATRTWRATDACGNQATCSQTVTVVDTTVPVISCVGNKTVQCGTAWSFDTPTATDTCGTNSITIIGTVTNAACGNTFSATRTWQAMDACGNNATCSQTVTVIDTTPPVITCVSNKTVECTAPWTFDSPTATDICGTNTIVVANTVTNPGCGNTFTTTRTWRATDGCGNQATCSQTVTVVDTTVPVISCVGNKTAQCGTAWTFDAPTATDTCGTNTITIVSTTTNAGCGNTFTTTRTWRATDACGNQATCSQTVTIVDTTAPTITCATNKTIQCGTAWTFNSPTATDTCGTNTITVVSTTTNAGCGNTLTATRTWRATDACGNTAQCSQIVTVVDTTPPVITCPTNVTLACPADTSTNATGVATATDGCSTPTITFSDSVSNICGISRVISRTWRATDPCGNSSTCVQTITVRDLSLPVITCPTNVTVECGGSTAPSATGTATATDACGTPTVSYSDAVTNNCGGSRVITRTWTATDACTNRATCIQTITVRDRTPPALTLPTNRVLDCPADTRTNVTGVATATDACGSVTISYSEVVSNSCGSTRTIWRTWTATDQCGNTTNGLQTIIVRDTTAPTINCPNIAVQCVGDVPAPYASLAAFQAAGGTATDACDAALTFSMTSNSVLVGSCPRTGTRVYRVTDDCGNFAEVTQRITVDDTIAPVLTCPPGVTVECGISIAPASLGLATATDNCSTNLTITNSDSVVQGEYDLKFYVADPDTNTGPYAPTFLQLGPGSLPCPDAAQLTGRALDPLRNAVAYSPNGQLDALTSIGNVPMALGEIVPYEVVIQASGGPGPERGTIEFTSSWSTYTTSNNRFGYDTNYMVYCAFVDAADPGSIDPNYNARVESYSATVINRGTIDEAIQGTFRVSGLDAGDRVVVEIWVVLDSTMPDHTGGTVSASLVSAQKASVPPVPISIGNQTDSLGNLSKITTLPPPQPQPPLGPLPPQPPVPPGATINVIDRTWSATDDCGNRSTCVQRITVRDTTPPSLVVPTNTVIECPAVPSTNITGVAVASDVCGTVKVSYNDSVTNLCGGTKVVSRLWTATDESGNSTNVVQTITVQDTTPPVLSCLPGKVVATNQAWSFGQPSATDNCGPATVQMVGTATNLIGQGEWSATCTWRAVDACGNASTCQQTVTIMNPPKLKLICVSTNKLMLLWSALPSGFSLETSDNLLPSNWTPMSVTPLVSNGFNCVEFSPTIMRKFYRLHSSAP